MDRMLIQRAVREVGELLGLEDYKLATAESCTGGLLASTLTDVSGSSEWFQGSVVAYSNDVKQNLLGVPGQDLMDHGAVSEVVVKAMAEGVKKAVGADVSVAISGIAGPTGGTPDKPVGMVWMAWSWPYGTKAKVFRFDGGRDAVKAQSVMAAVNGLMAILR